MQVLLVDVVISHHAVVAVAFSDRRYLWYVFKLTAGKIRALTEL